MRVLFYGDSNTYGFDPRDPFDDRYPASVRWTDRLAAALSEPTGNDRLAAALSEPTGSDRLAAALSGTVGSDRTPELLSGPTGTDRIPAEPAETGHSDRSSQVRRDGKSSQSSQWEVIARGQNGRCVPSMPQMSAWIKSMIREVWPVDRFAVMLGTNDLLQTHRPDAAFPAAQMRQFLLFLRKEFPEMERMLIAPPVLFEDLTEGVFFRRCQEESRRLTKMYGQIARETDSLFADAGAWKIDLAADYVHFSEKGHAQFAQRMLELFQ